jgi:hypothetical protein
MIHRFARFLAILFCLGLTACTPSLYHWGEYEDSLYKRQIDTSEKGQVEAFKMLEVTIQEAEMKNYRVPPGVYADYGYFLFKQGRADEAITYFKKEAVTYKESQYLMESVISRIEKKKMQ